MGCCCFTIAAAVVFVLGCLLKLYIKLTMAWDRSATCLVGKTAIVTGANTGIGLYTAMDFAKRGARVILACRNREKAEEARDKIVKETGNPNVVVKIIDMESLASVRDFAKDITDTEERLDILVNNAGAMYTGNKTTEDGLSLLMQTNHFSNFLLTHLLIDKLKQSAPSRIVNVSSLGAKFGELDPNNLNAYPKSRFSEMKNYSNTKLANILFTVELAKKLKDTGITANSLHPGGIRTELNRNMVGISYDCLMWIFRFFLKTAEEGAQTTIYVAVAKDIEGVTGQHFDRCKRIPLYKSAQDANLAKKVWEKSEQFVKLTPSEKLK